MGNSKQRQERDEDREIWRENKWEEKDEASLRIRDWCKEGDREDTKSLFVSLTASNNDSNGTNFCCPHPHRTSVDNISLWMSVHTCTHLQMYTRTRIQTAWREMILCSGRTNCLVFINNIYLMPVTQTQTDRAGREGGIDKGQRIDKEEEADREVKKRIEGKQGKKRKWGNKTEPFQRCVIETNELYVKCYACPCSPSLRTTLILISASPRPHNMIWTAAAQYILQYKPQSHLSSLTTKTNHTTTASSLT